MVRSISTIAGALFVVAVASAVACGGGGGPETADDAAQVRTVIGALAEAMHKGDWGRLYTSFDEKTKEHCTLDQFSARAEAARDFFAQIDVEVLDVSVDGDAARADLMVYYSGEGTENTWELVREDGEWRLSTGPGTEPCAALNNGQTPGP